MSEIKLLPCPFCGGEARLCSFHSQTIKTYKEYWVKCKNDCCQTKNFRSEEETIEHWNTRKPIDRIVAELEKEKCTRVTYEDKYAQGWNNGIQNAIFIVRKG